MGATDSLGTFLMQIFVFLVTLNSLKFNEVEKNVSRYF